MSSSSTNDFEYSVQVTNANYRSHHDKPFNLMNLHLLLPKVSKLHIKPKQLTIKDSKGTIVLFGNGQMRIMGCNDELEATFLAYKYTTMFDKDCNFQPVYAQSMTVKIDCSMKINLIKFARESKLSPLQYEPELFPAVLLKKFKPISVNVFSSGKIIMCGVREIEQVDAIMKELKEDLIMCKLL